MRKRIAALLGTLMASLALIILSASPAAAAETNYVTDAAWNSDAKACFTAITGTTYSKVNGCFEADGDLLWLQDKSADGYGVAMWWNDIDSGRGGTCIHNLGADHGWATCDKDFIEGNTITWTIGWDSAAGWVKSTKIIYSAA